MLSTLASAGILVLASSWRDLLARWMPAVLAEAVAVPMAAQVVCTPVIADDLGPGEHRCGSRQPRGRACGRAGHCREPGGRSRRPAERRHGPVVGRLAGVPLWWIVWVAEHGARLSGASIEPGGPASCPSSCWLCCARVTVVMSPLVLPSRVPCVAVMVLLVAVLLDPLGRLGWPPSGWVMVMCDVGQGDGLVLNAGHGVAVVVDTGPDPLAERRCLGHST